MFHINHIYGLTLVFAVIGSGRSQIVNTTLGAVEGITLLSRGNRSFSAFLGIPYAKPPLGDLRFQAPEPAEPWNGLRDASTYGNICPQFSESSPTNSTGDEDCLYINVFTPANLEKNQGGLPVLVYIHGGYFMVLAGSNYGPLYFMDHDIVLVTFNYRLGAFGFLSTLDEYIPGNAGMKDQVLALRWIQENIEYFGGDKSRVNIYGESAGAASVHYHLLSPLSQGLYSAAISGSGTSFKVLSLQLSPVQVVNKLAEEVGCETAVGNSSELVSCLRSVDSGLIAAKSYEFTQVLKDPLRMFCPSIEANGSAVPSFLDRHPYQLMSEGHQQVVPWMAGFNSGEGQIVTLGIYSSEEWTNEMNQNWTSLAPDFLLYNRSDTELTEKINEFYLNLTGSESIDLQEDMQGFTNIFSDRLYIDATLEAVRVQSEFSPVYLYYNDYSTSANSMNYGTIHGEELALLFSPANFSAPIIDDGHVDFEQSKIMVDLWVQFVTDPSALQYNGNSWTPVASPSLPMTCMNFKNPGQGEQGIGPLPQIVTTRVNFWRNHGIPPYEEF